MLFAEEGRINEEGLLTWKVKGLIQMRPTDFIHFLTHTQTLTAIADTSGASWVLFTTLALIQFYKSLTMQNHAELLQLPDR